MIKIALVHEWLTNVAGSERVLLELVGMFPKAPIYTSVYDPKHAKPFERCEIHSSFLQKIPLMKSKRELLVPLTPLAFEQFDLSGYDVVISSSHMAAKGVLTKPDTAHISYCHTPPRYLWEPDVDPRAKRGKLAWLRRNIAHNMRMWDRLAAERVDHYLANSRFVASRIKKYYGRDAAVVYPPVDVDKYQPVPAGQVENYFLFASRLVGYKRCDLVVDAFNQIKLPLKILGRGPEEKRLKKKAGANIEFLGFLPDEDMKKYYAKAKAFIFPVEDDFGIVPVEAMASGRPVIAYRGGGAMESVVAGKTGEFFDEQTPQSLIKVIESFEVEKYDPARIRQQAMKFSTEKFRENFMKEYEKVLRGHTSRIT